MTKERITRRAVLAAGAAGVGLLATGGTAEAAPEEQSKFAAVKTPAQYQVVAATLANRCHRDKKFAEEMRTEPVKVLKGLGISSDALRELVHEDGFLREKFGTKLGADGMCTVTCITTECCFTCWLGSSLGATPAEVHFAGPDSKLKASKERAHLVENLIKQGHIISPH
jgi:hypothetical protein